MILSLSGRSGLSTFHMPCAHTYSHHVYAKTSHKDVQLAEVGPRFEAKREYCLTLLEVSISDQLAYEIRQGTLDQKEADIEWLYRPYMRTAKKRNQL